MTSWHPPVGQSLRRPALSRNRRCRTLRRAGRFVEMRPLRTPVRSWSDNECTYHPPRPWRDSFMVHKRIPIRAVPESHADIGRRARGHAWPIVIYHPPIHESSNSGVQLRLTMKLSLVTLRGAAPFGDGACSNNQNAGPRRPADAQRAKTGCSECPSQASEPDYPPTVVSSAFPPLFRRSRSRSATCRGVRHALIDVDAIARSSYTY